MGTSGEDVQLSQQARDLVPFVFEAKARAAFIGYNWWEQAQTHCKRPEDIPVVVVRANHAQPLAIIHLDSLLALLDNKNNAN